MANPVLDAATPAISSSGVLSLTFAHTVGTLTNGALVVDVGFYDRVRSVASVTFNGVACTFDTSYDNGVAAAKQEVWKLANPSAGTHNVVITLSASGPKIVARAASYSHVDQSTIIEATKATSVVTGSHTTHSNSLTPANNGALVVGALLCGGTAAPTATGSGQTADAAASDGTAIAHAVGETGPVSPAASTTSSWSFGSSSTASNQIVYALIPEASGVTGTGSGSFGLSASGTGAETFSGSGAGSIRPTASGAGTETFSGAGAASFGLSASGTGAETFSGVGSAAFRLAASGTGNLPITGTGSASFGIAASGTGTVPVTAVGGGPRPKRYIPVELPSDKPLPRQKSPRKVEIPAPEPDQVTGSGSASLRLVGGGLGRLSSLGEGTGRLGIRATGRGYVTTLEEDDAEVLQAASMLFNFVA